MPIRVYMPVDDETGCEKCRPGFEHIEPIDGLALIKCPFCGVPVRRELSPPRIGTRPASFDDRAKAAGFHKLKRDGDSSFQKLY